MSWTVLDALRSDENAYTSFTGKSDNMDWKCEVCH